MDLSKSEETKISKFLSLILRHQPEEAGLILDKEGWVDIDELIVEFNKRGFNLTFQKLEYVVDNNDKKRFSINGDLTKIKANQGHSLEIDLKLLPQKPPKYLFHGTAKTNIEGINKEGIHKKNRQYVHLSNNIENAIKVGARHGSPVVLKVESELMYNDGYKFFLSENNVWLTDFVPVKYIIKT